MTVRKAELEDRFLELLQSLRLRSGFFELFREIVVDCWKTEAAEAQKTAAQLERRVSEIRQKLQRVDDRFMADEIDGRSYRELRDRLRYDLTLTEIDRNDARLNETDVEGVLGFAEHVMQNAAALWTNASADDRKALQATLFPNALAWDGTGFGTVTTCLAFNQLEGFRNANNGMASPPGFEPGFQP
jgi:site-specific DNA recombinase